MKIIKRKSPVANALNGIENGRKLKIINEKCHKPSRSFAIPSHFNFLMKNETLNEYLYLLFIEV